MSHLLVTGGTGALGAPVVRGLLDRGQEVRVLSRHARAADPGAEHVVADLGADGDLTAAFRGVDTVVHLAGTAKGDGAKARRVVAAARRAEVRHLVFVSVVGADRVPVVSARDRMAFGYYGEKRAAELAIEGSGIPWTTLRATQFHELLLRTASGMARGPAMIAFRGVRFQPIAADEVAERVVGLALAEPAGLVEPMGGPEVAPMADLLRGYLRASGRRRPVLTLGSGGAAAAAITAGANLAPDHAVGRRTWAQFLAVQAE